MALRGKKRFAVLLLEAGLLCVAAGLLLTPGGYSAPARVQVTAVTPLNGQILRELNRVRRAHGLGTLAPSPRLGWRRAVSLSQRGLRLLGGGREPRLAGARAQREAGPAEVDEEPAASSQPAQPALARDRPRRRAFAVGAGRL